MPKQYTDPIDPQANAAKCLVCGAVIISTYRHEWVACDCPEESRSLISVDGGADYRRWGGGGQSRWQEWRNGAWSEAQTAQGEES